jgi:PAS domain S-box-containing protein
VSVNGPAPAAPGHEGPAATSGGLLDLLKVAAVLLDDRGRIQLWSPQAEDVFGYTAEEALGRFAGPLVVHEEHMELVSELFEQVMTGDGLWAGGFPIRHRDGSTHMVEFRNMRLQDARGRHYALGLCSRQSTLRRVERDLALSTRLVSQSPIGLAVLDPELRYVTVNPAEEQLTGVPAAERLGRKVQEVLPALDAAGYAAAAEEVLRTGTPVLDRYTVGRTPADPQNDHAWSISFYRLEAPSGQVLGVATSTVDVTERHRAVQQQRRTALALQRSLLPSPPPPRPGLTAAARYQPAEEALEVGGDWFDVIPLTDDKTALVVGDVMGNGIVAAAMMGQLRTATRTLAHLDLSPASVLQHLNRITDTLDPSIATCVFAVYDPHRSRCHLSLAGHLPPVVLRADGRAELLDLPTGAPLGVGEVGFRTTTVPMGRGDQLLLYTDGLVETRDQAIDRRLRTLLRLLDDPLRPLDQTCDLLLTSLRHPGVHDDVALLLARAEPLHGRAGAAGREVRG